MFNSKRLMVRLLTRYKGLVAVVAFGFISLIIAVVIGGGLIVYRAGEYIVQSNFLANTPEAIADNVEKKLPAAQSILLDTTTGIIKTNLVRSELYAALNGLACIDGIGGPSPVEIVDFMQQRITDPAVQEHIANLKAKVASTQAVASGAKACSEWLLRSLN